ncbi:hypothetical protein [Caenispirillum salinarum]|uniref:hypothetical protein n=1 Tax=Caenispirillum salinarum TaxID=859058 RepID=UPI00384BE5B7
MRRSRAALRIDPDRLHDAARRDDRTIAEEAEADPASAPVQQPENWRGAELIEPETTVQVTLRVHRDTLRAFQADGPGAEQRMARVLDEQARQQTD